MNTFKRPEDTTALAGALSVYRAQRCLGCSEDSAIRMAALHFASTRGTTYADSRATVAAHLAQRANRAILGGAL